MKKVYLELIDNDLQMIKEGKDVVYELYTYDENGKQQGDMIEIIARKEPCKHLNY